MMHAPFLLVKIPDWRTTWKAMRRNGIL